MAEFEVSVNDKQALPVAKEEINGLEKIDTDEYFTIEGINSYHGRIKEVDVLTKTVRLEINGNTYSCKIAEPIDLVLKSLNLNSKNQNIKADLISTMPGLVLNVLVTEGQVVTTGEPLMILEAMKMENVLKAAYAGTIQKICCTPGDAVDKGQLLIEIAH